MKATRFVVFVLLMAVAVGLGLVSTTQAQGCSISSFSMDPTPPYSLGTSVRLEGRSNCGTVRFEITNTATGQVHYKAEIGQPNQGEWWRTQETGSGNFDVCFVARGDGGWQNADRSCRAVYVEGGRGPGGNDGCSITSFSVAPSSGPVGHTFNLSGQGQCGNGVRASRFTIDGSAFGEFAGSNVRADWNSSGYSTGNHRICLQVTDGSWPGAEQCVNVQLTSVGTAPSTTVVQPSTTGSSSGSSSSSTSTSNNDWRGMDIAGWCQSIGHSGANLFGSTAYDWKCTNHDGSVARDIDVDAVCRHTHGGRLNYAHLGNANDAGSWTCQEYPQDGRPAAPAASTSGSSSGSSSSSRSSTTCNSRSRLDVGDIAVVSDATPDPLPLRAGPSTNDRVLVDIPIRTQVTIIGGPVCDGNLVWWETQYGGYTGWTAEINGYNNANLLPNGAVLPGSSSSGSSSSTSRSATDTCSNALSPTLFSGDRGRVTFTDGSPTTLRNRPQGDALAELPEGTEFDVIGDPQCTQARNGHLWWVQIRTDGGQVGYVPFGYQGGEYWVEPVAQNSVAANTGTSSRPAHVPIPAGYCADMVVDGCVSTLGGATVANATLVFVNGIRNSYDGHMTGLQQVGDAFPGNNVIGIYNGGLLNNQGVIDRGTAVDFLYDFLMGTTNRDVTIVGHSQGGAVIAVALQRLPDRRLFGGTNTITVVTFGTAGTRYPQSEAVEYTHCISSLDPVPVVLRNNRDRVDGVVVFDNDSRSPLREHSLAQYLSRYDDCRAQR